MKRLFDVLASLIALALLWPIMLLIAIAIKLDSRGPVLYSGERIGKEGKTFRILKFRTMVMDAAQRGGGLTYRGDPRITRMGRFLRRTKTDELPQLFNVVKGDMSLVGPRPEDARYLKYYSTTQRQLLHVRPGITSMASLRYRNEEQLLDPADWERIYVGTILPEKLDIELNYLANYSFGKDLLILMATVLILVAAIVRLDRWPGFLARVEGFLGRRVTWVGVDLVLIAGAFVTAFYIRFLLGGGNTAATIAKGVVVVGVYLVSNYLFGIYQRYWSFASARDSIVLFASAIVGTLIISVVDLAVDSWGGLALRGIVLAGFFVFCFEAVVRYRARLIDGAQQFLSEFMGFISGAGARVLVIGAGEEGQLLVWQLQNRLQGKAYQVVGLIDDDPKKRGLLIHNVRVYGGRNQLPEVATGLHPDLIILAIPPKKVRNPQELLSLCRATSAQIKIMPSLFDWLGHNENAPGWETVNEEDLLQRSARQVNEAACRELLEARVVMVTGAAGSIGSELCRQIASYHPSRMLMVDINESGLHELLIELRTQWPAIDFDLVLCDITNIHKMADFFALAHPQIVFHAAAYKHVPILEEFPQEGVRVNIQGSLIVHSLALQYGAERFVFISSDKAVNPSNVLGMTKWIGELVVTEHRPGEQMLSAAVRFGNVLGSRGSVVPTFEKQIEMGGPLTITHPDMTRFFLTISEAVSLVIQAAAMTRGGDLFALDMGVPVRILDLARRMIRARGLRPGKDIQIEFIGMRPGEKMNEELISPAEEKCPTDHQAIFRIERMAPLDLSNLEQQADELVSFSMNGSTPAEIRTALREWVDRLQSSAVIIPNQLPVELVRD